MSVLWLLASSTATATTVADAIAVGDCATALDLLAEAPGEEAVEGLAGDARALARGWCLMRQGNASAALAAVPEEGPLQSYAALIDAVHQEQVASQSHQDLPFEKLVDELGIDRDLSRHPSSANRRARTSTSTPLDYSHHHASHASSTFHPRRSVRQPLSPHRFAFL